MHDCFINSKGYRIENSTNSDTTKPLTSNQIKSNQIKSNACVLVKGEQNKNISEQNGSQQT